jgi:hypothetical protein
MIIYTLHGHLKRVYETRSTKSTHARCSHCLHPIPDLTVCATCHLLVCNDCVEQTRLLGHYLCPDCVDESSYTLASPRRVLNG